MSRRVGITHSHANGAFLCAASQEILFPVIEHVEERPRDGFENRRLARAVLARNSGDAPRETKLRALVRFNIIEFDPCDVHKGSGQWSVVSGQ